MKSLFVSLFIFSFTFGFGQDCPEYQRLMKEGKAFAKNKNYRAALNKYNSAKLCEPSKSNEVDEKINLLFDAIENEKEEAVKGKKEAVIAKKTTEAHLDSMSNYISQITNLIQSDKTSGIIGFTPFKSQLLKILIPANQFIAENRTVEDNSWKRAVAHLQLSLSFDNEGKSIDSNKELDLALTEFEKVFNYNLKNKIALDNDLIQNYLISIYMRVWNLITMEGYDSAKKLLSKAEKVIMNTDLKEAKINSAIASIENSKSYLYSQLKIDSLDEFHSEKAVQFVQNALQIEPDNESYKIQLAIFLSNSTLRNEKIDAVEKKNRNQTACDIYQKIGSTPGAGYKSINGIANCVRDESYTLEKQNKADEALEKLLEVIKQLSNAIFLEPENIEYRINRSWLYQRAGEIAAYSKNDNALATQYIHSSIDDWVEYVKNNTTTYDLWKVKNIYDDFSDILKYVEQENKLEIYERFNNAFNENVKLYSTITPVLEIVTKNHGDISEEYLAKKTPIDSVKAYQFLEKATYAIENKKLVEKEGGYREAYYKYGNIYTDKISLLLARGKLDSALQDYRMFNKILYPIYQKYPFDVYLRSQFTNSAESLGERLYLEKRYEEAIPILTFASKNGKDESSKLLSKIYRSGLSVDEDTKLADSLEKISSKQIIKELVIPLDVNGTDEEFTIFVRENSKEYPYKGIEDQVEWLLVARREKVPVEYREAFIEIQNFAWKNDKSYPELCTRDLKTIVKNKVIRKYSFLKQEILNETEKSKKGSLYKKLYDIYEADLAKVTYTERLETIKEDAIEFYMEYAKFLDKNTTANLIYNRVLELDSLNEEAKGYPIRQAFEENKSNPAVLISTEKTESLVAYLKLYLAENNEKASSIILKKILSIEDTPEIRYEINQLYNNSGISIFESLFLSDTKKIAEYREFYIDHLINISDDYKSQKEYYLELVRLDEEYLKVNKTIRIKKQVSRHYNSLAWNCLLSKDFNFIKYLERCLKLDTDNLYATGNLPHYYLFNNEFKKAKDLYLKLKDMPFAKNSEHKTFKQAFLDDFRIFESEGITHEKITEIKKLLGAEEEEVEELDLK